MKPFRFLLLPLFGTVLLASCGTTRIDLREIPESDPEAVELVRASRQAHGQEAFSRVRDISVSYEGSWGKIGPRFQPVIVDSRFRRESEERLILPERIIAQKHLGPGGRKTVLRYQDEIAVTYNGEPSGDEEVKLAAALVADAYKLFLLGPFFFLPDEMTFVMNGESKVDGEICDEVLAVVRPGFGQTEEDRVILSISRETRQLRRVRMTLNGFESTRGAEVDLTYREYREIGGILWPTDFDERIRSPFDLHAHHWTLRGLDINRGLELSDLAMDGWSEKAAQPAVPVSE